MRTYFNDPGRLKIAGLALWDAIIVLCIFIFSYAMRILVVERGTMLEIPGRLTWLVILGTATHIVMFYIFGLYDRNIMARKKLFLIKLIISIVAASMFIGFFSFLFPAVKMGRIVVTIHVGMMILAMYTWRHLSIRLLFAGGKEKILIIGWDNLIEKVSREILSSTSPYMISGIVYPGQTKNNSTHNDLPVFDRLESALETTSPNVILTAKDIEMSAELESTLIDLRFAGCQVFDGPTFNQQISGRVPVEDINEKWILFNRAGEIFQSEVYLRGKRIMDLCISVLVLLATSPVLILIAFLIKLESKGPVFFKQERLGLNEQPFTLLKFRTMIDNAEKETGPRWASENDTRYTRIGKFLRKTRMDELPQFINVMRGQMSLVGPRPIRKHFADIFTEKFPFYRLRFKVKPGITGWAQVHMNYVNTDKDQYAKLEYEFYYIYQQSLLLDLFIMLKTIQSVLMMRGG